MDRNGAIVPMLAGAMSTAAGALLIGWPGSPAVTGPIATVATATLIVVPMLLVVAAAASAAAATSPTSAAPLTSTAPQTTAASVTPPTSAAACRLRRRDVHGAAIRSPV